MNIALPTMPTFAENLWDDPAPVQRKPRRTRTKKQVAPALSSHVQSSKDMSDMLGIGLFEYVEHPITHHRVLFYSAYDSLVKDYGWLNSTIINWGMVEKHMVDRAKRLAELSYGR